MKTTKPCNSPHTITIERRPDNIPLICTGAGPIHPVHSQHMSLATKAIDGSKSHHSPNKLQCWRIALLLWDNKHLKLQQNWSSLEVVSSYNDATSLSINRKGSLLKGVRASDSLSLSPSLVSHTFLRNIRARWAGGAPAKIWRKMQHCHTQCKTGIPPNNIIAQYRWKCTHLHELNQQIHICWENQPQTHILVTVWYKCTSWTARRPLTACLVLDSSALDCLFRPWSFLDSLSRPCSSTLDCSSRPYACLLDLSLLVSPCLHMASARRSASATHCPKTDTSFCMCSSGSCDSVKIRMSSV